MPLDYNEAKQVFHDKLGQRVNGHGGFDAAMLAMCEYVYKRAMHDAFPEGVVTVTTNTLGECVAVTRQNEEGKVLSVIWQRNDIPDWMTEAALVKMVCAFTGHPAEYFGYSLELYVEAMRRALEEVMKSPLEIPASGDSIKSGA